MNFVTADVVAWTAKRAIYFGQMLIMHAYHWQRWAEGLLMHDAAHDVLSRREVARRRH